MQSKVALIFIFNHRFDKNIPVLEKIYKERFSHIYHLVPFYDGSRPNVIPVYDNSFYFQGYLAQGFKHYFAEEYDHYIFIGDDLIINPAINENNYKEYFSLSAEDSFIPEIFDLHNFTNQDTLRFLPLHTINGKKKLFWSRVRDVVNYKHGIYGTESRNEMPSYNEAEAIINKHGHHIKPLTYQDVYGPFPISFETDEKRRMAGRYVKNIKSYTKKFTLSYPLVASYSDILIVSKSSIKKFCHYCGVFAANELFVEMAIPTALLLSSEKVVTEPEIGMRGDIYWSYMPQEAANYDAAMRAYQYNLQELFQHFPTNKLYIHPIKLSKWKTEKI